RSPHHGRRATACSRVSVDGGARCDCMLSGQSVHNQASGAPAAEGAFGERIVALATRLAEFSETPDGLTCTYMTPSHRAVAARLREWMEAAGMATRIDGVGNVIGRYAAAD